MLKGIIDIVAAIVVASNTSAINSTGAAIVDKNNSNPTIVIESQTGEVKSEVEENIEIPENPIIETEKELHIETELPEVSKPVIEPQVVRKENFDYDIASYTTKYGMGKSATDRNYNMKLASNAINGVILKPGDTFSYNDTILSKRNKNDDYRVAGILVAGEPSTGIGGGICQISSTLYEAALYSGMTITERHNHSAKVGYMPAGRDATVSWGGPDLKFRNDLSIPVKIESVMENGIIKIRFFGDGNPEIGEVKVTVSNNNGVYKLYRYINGVYDYSATSVYKK